MSIIYQIRFQFTDDALLTCIDESSQLCNGYIYTYSSTVCLKGIYLSIEKRIANWRLRVCIILPIKAENTEKIIF